MEKENLREVKKYFEHIHSLVYATKNESLRNEHNKAYQIVYDMLNPKYVEKPLKKSILKKEEQIALLKRSVAEWNEWRKENISIIPNLQYANLQNANLQSADLQNANLRGADLQNVNLRRANLQGADLRDVDLRCANLQNANLRGADLQGADLRDVDLRCANLQNANLRGADLRDAYLQGADLRHTKRII